MRNRLLFLLCTTTLWLVMVGCWQRSEPITLIRPVKTTEVKPLAYYDKEFVGTVSAVEWSNLAFRVGGLIDKMNIVTGSVVEKGQIIAELDQSDFKLQLAANKSSFETAQSNLQRCERLLAKQAISVQDYENARAQLEQAKASYTYSQYQMEYSKLRAPFSGSIEHKYVENFQRVNAGESVCKLINPNLLEVNFILPQSDIAMTKLKKGFYVEFTNYSNQLFSAVIKEVVDALVDGAGIPVTLTINDPNFGAAKYNIKPGFACRVKVQIKGEVIDNQYFSVPITAIFSPIDVIDKKFVWLYNPSTSTVNRVEVTTNGLVGNDNVIVSSGLSSGDIVVTAGIYQITEGQKVTLN